MKSLSVAQITSYFTPSIGGVERHVYDLSQNLVSKGIDVHIFTSRLKATPSIEISDNLVVHRLPSFNLGKAKIAPGLIPELLKHSFDLIHVHAPGHYFLQCAVLYKMLKEVPLVITCHMYRSRERFLNNIYDRTFYSWGLKNAEKIIFTTSSYASDVLGFQNQNGKIKIIPNAVNLKQLALSSYDIMKVKDKLKLTGSPVVLFVGSLERSHYYKRVDILIQAFKTVKKNIPNAKLIIVGGGELLPQLKKLAEPLHNSVLFLGAISDKYLRTIYKLADVFVLSSVGREEAFGIVLLEAMTFKVPVIAPNLEGVNEVINGTGLLYEPGNVEKLANAIQYVLTNKEKAKSMGYNGRKLVESKYSFEIVTKQILDVYNEVLNK